MEQLIIFLLFVIGSIVSSYFQNKKKREIQQAKRRATTPPASESSIPPWAGPARSWQEQLRRMLEESTRPAPPPPIPARPALPPRPQPVPARGLQKAAAEPSEGTLVFQSPLMQSETAYARAAQLGTRVEKRMEAVDRQTKSHVPGALPEHRRSFGAAIARRWTQNRDSVREAFVASLIFAPPVSLVAPSETEAKA